MQFLGRYGQDEYGHQVVEHLRDLDSIDPQTCRDAAEQWTPAGMARRYLDLYHRLLEENPT